MWSVLTFDQKTFDLGVRAVSFIFESSGQCIFEGFLYFEARSFFGIEEKVYFRE